MAVSTMASIPALKTVHQQLKTRMEKAVTTSGRTWRHAHGAREYPDAGSCARFVLRRGDAADQVAQLSIPDAQTILISPFDPSAIAEIEKGLRTADSSFNPQNDGKVVRLKIPAMTEERRKDVVKQLTSARRASHRHSQCAARRQRSDQESGEGQADLRGRGEALAR